MLASLLNPVDGDGGNESSEDHTGETEHGRKDNGDGSSSSNSANTEHSNSIEEAAESKTKTHPVHTPESTPRGSRKRRHGKRSRSGCLTFRRRKKKCAEERPVCRHCHRLGLACVWENAPASVLPPLSTLSLHSLPPSTSSSFSSTASLSPVSVPSTDLSSHGPASLHMSSFSYIPPPPPPAPPRYTTVDQFRGSPEETYVEGIGYVRILRGKVESRRRDR